MKEISFDHFKIAYALTSKGDLAKKLEYAFLLYDCDNSGTLDRNELRTVLTGMLDLLGKLQNSSSGQSLTT